jgi:hypothetical protein
VSVNCAPTRTHRRHQPVDLATFRTEIDAALAAFTEDVSYACSMARSAVMIGRKRDMWQTRKDQRTVDSKPTRPPR